MAKDAIQVVLKENCNDDGTGGTVLDSPTVLLPVGELANLLQAYEDEYGMWEVDNPSFDDQQPEGPGNERQLPVGQPRNFAVRIRHFCESVFRAWGVKQARAAAETNAKAAAQATMDQITVI